MSEKPVAIITGGSRGVGEATAKLLSSKGWNVTITCTSTINDANLVVEECKKLGADYVVDHRKPNWHKQVRMISKEISKETGRAPGIDVSFDHIGQTHWNNQLTVLKNVCAKFSIPIHHIDEHAYTSKMFNHLLICITTKTLLETLLKTLRS